MGVGSSGGRGGGEGDGQRVCARLTSGLHAARLGLGLDTAPGPRLAPASGPGLGPVDHPHHRSAAVVSSSLRYLKEAFSALCKLGAGRCCQIP